MDSQQELFDGSDFLTPRTAAVLGLNDSNDGLQAPSTQPTRLVLPPLDLQPDEPLDKSGAAGESDGENSNSLSMVSSNAVTLAQQPKPQQQAQQHQNPPTDLHPAIQQLQNAMFGCFQSMMDRINMLENNMSVIHQYIENQKQYGQDVTSTVNQHTQPKQLPQAPPTQQQQPRAQQPDNTQPKAFHLKMEGVKNLWYTERPFPPFSIKVVESATGNLYRKANDWRVTIHLYDGHGMNCDEKLVDDKMKSQFLTEGIAEVSGLRFKQVSSKNGNFFTLQCEVAHPPDAACLVQRGVSENITIMSCRLFACRKGSFSRLGATDSASKMPGIGRLYGQRLCSNGVKTIGDLAALPLGDAGLAVRAKLLEAIRRDKGSLTDLKLIEHIKTAQAIVSGEYKTDDGKRKQPEDSDTQSSSDAAGHSPKRRQNKNKTAAFAVAAPVEGNAQPVQPPNGVAGNGAPANGAGTKEDKAMEKLNMLAQQTNEIVTDCFKFLNPESMDHHNTAAYDLFDTYETVGTNDLLDNNVAFRSAGGKVEGEGNGIRLVGDAVKAPKKKILVKDDKAVPYCLHVAVASGKKSNCEVAVRSLRAKKQPVDQVNPQGFTALMLASSLGRVDVVRFLTSLPEISAGKAREDNGWTALHMAAVAGHTAVVEVLLSGGADVSCPTKQGTTAAMLAAMQGHSSMIELLAKRCEEREDNKSLITQTSENGLGVLHFASFSGSADSVKLALGLWKKAGLEEDETKDTPSVMHCGVLSGEASIVKQLVVAGFTTKCGILGGWIPLHLAAMRGDVESVVALCDADDNATVNQHTDEGWTPLSLAPMATQGDGAAVASLLVKRGAVDEHSKVPASVVSVVLANVAAWVALGSGTPQETLDSAHELAAAVGHHHVTTQ